MSPEPTTSIQTSEGDNLRRWGRILIFASVFCAVLAIVWFPIFRVIWPSFLEMRHGGILFVAGLLVLFLPALTLVAGWRFLVKSLSHPRSIATPITDRIIAVSVSFVGFAFAIFGAYEVWLGATTGVAHFKGGVAISMQGHPSGYWLIMVFWVASTLLFTVGPIMATRKLLREMRSGK